MRKLLSTCTVLKKFFTHIYIKSRTSAKHVASFVIKKGNQHITIMFIPQSENKIFNFQVSNFALAFFLLVSCTVGFGGTYLYVDRTNIEQSVSSLNARYKENRKILDGVKLNISPIIQLEKKISDTTKDLVSIANADTIQKKLSKSKFQGGPESQGLQSFSEELLNASNSEKNKNWMEVYRLMYLDKRLSVVHSELNNLKNLLKGYQNILKTIPSIFPVVGSSVGRGYVTSGFGWRRDPFTRTMVKHRGLDIVNITGTPVVATAHGVVKSAGRSSTKGLFVEIRHEYGYTTHFFHLSAIHVKKGQHVQKGQVVGRLGSTGRSTGPHLHYEIHVNRVNVDPFPFINLDKFSNLS